MITLRDGCGLDTEEAKQTMLWAAHAILNAAQDDARAANAHPRGGRGKSGR